MTPTCIQNTKLFFLIIGVIITGSIQHITIPLMAAKIPSLYFLVLLIATEGLILYITILLSFTIYYRSNVFIIENKPLFLTIGSGITSGLMSICLLYSANPERTPVVIQSIFLGTAIIPSIIFTKVILQKYVQYDLKYAILSLIFLLVSIGISIIPLFQTENKFSPRNIGWIIMYSSGIVLYSLYNIIQEKYIIDTADTTFQKKIRFALYSGIFQVLTVICLFWIDLLLGYNNNLKEFGNTFIQSFFELFDNFVTSLLIQLFIFDCLVLFIISIYLNEISTNYNMILTNLTNQSVALFFTIFPALNTGIKYPLSITMLSMLCNIISVMIWIKSEPQKVFHDDEDVSTLPI